jgi:hypothetical protein
VHRRRFILIVSSLALLVVVTAAASYSSQEEVLAKVAPTDPTGSTTSQAPQVSLASGSYVADLTGPASGSGAATIAVLTLEYDAETGTLSYVLDVTAELANPSVAAICQGSPGARGTTVVTLFPGPTLAGSFSGVLAEGTLADEDLVGPLRSGTVADLVRLVDAGTAYATIGTTDFPIDAVRGQLGRLPPALPEAPDGDTSI